jgi:uncharacterized membrane protein YbhN (UPF0104 family)
VRAVTVTREPERVASSRRGARPRFNPIEAVRSHPRTAAGVAVAMLASAAAVAVAAGDHDSGEDLGGAIASTARAAAHLRWQFGIIVVALGATHYLAAAVAARAVAGAYLPFGETFLVQLSAAAANRITPAGLGGAALIARYFVRRGGLAVPAAAGAVTTLTVLGGLADLLVFALLLTVGSWVGLAGGAAELSRLGQHVQAALGPVRSPWLWVVVGLLAMAVTAVWLTRHRASVTAWATGFVSPAVRLGRRPGDLLALLVASGSTTLVLAIAFAASVAMVPGRSVSLSAGGLIIAFMLGSAAGNLVPVPAGLGATEAALAAVLVEARLPTAQAIEVVLMFRIITFWAPAVLGVFTASRLRARKAI